MSDHDDVKDVSKLDDNLFVKLKCKAFGNKQNYDFKLTMREFFEGMNIPEPLFKLNDSPSTLTIKMQTLDDKKRLLQLSNTEKDQWVIYKTPVTASLLDFHVHNDWVRTITGAREGALDMVQPHRMIPYETQLKNKVEALKSYVSLANWSSELQLKAERKIGNKYISNIPTFDEPIKSPKERGAWSEYIWIDLEYDVKNNQAEAGVRLFHANGNYYFLPIEDCTHISPEIIAVAEHFVAYLNANMDDLKEFKGVNEENKTGFIQRLRCSVGDKGEVMLSVMLPYYSNDEEFAPLDVFDEPVSLKEIVAGYRSKQNGETQSDEQMEVDPQEELKTGKPKIPDWSSETGNPKGYKFVAKDFQDCHPSFRYFDVGQADSHLNVAVPFLTKFYKENKEKLRIHGIYTNWIVASRNAVTSLP
uniref:Uncharacterized protein n=1 Tax=Lygus hesperus TaxID=30085 RepID=A0A0K8TF24_LYGHE